MRKLSTWLIELAAVVLGTFGAGTLALAQENPDLAPRFQNSISAEEYHKLRDEHLGLLRGLPADPALRETALAMQRQQRLAQSAMGPNVFSPGAWDAIGPNPIPNGQVAGAGPVGGRVTAFAIDPTKPNTVYLGTAQGGVYRSVDGGTNWTPIFDTAATSAIGSLALAPSNPSILYIGTGEANGSADSYAGVGMYRIDNCDTTATLVGPINPVRTYSNPLGDVLSIPVFSGRSISSILVHPTDPSIVFAGIAGGVIGIGGDLPLGGNLPPLGMRGLVRLTNATSAPGSVVAQKLAVTAAASGFDLPNTGNRNVNSMIFDPSDPNVLVVWINGSAAAGDGGVYRSTNAQSANPTFTQVHTTVTNSARGEFAGYKEGANPPVIYVATGEGSTGRLRRSVDGGVTWSATIAGGNGFCSTQCFYNIGLDVRPGATTAVTDDIVVLGGNVAGASSRLFAKSVDGGTNFTESSSGLHADNHFIRFDPNDNNIIWHGNDGGVFKSTNGGTTWVSLNNSQINTVQFSGFAVHPTIERWAIGGTQDNGTNMRSGDGTWKRIDYGDGGYALIDRNATDETNITLYHTYFNQTNNLMGFGRVLSSACATDGEWAFKGVYSVGLDTVTQYCDGKDTFNGIVLTDAVLFYAPMELGPGNPNTVYYGAGAVYRSTDKGETMPAVSQRTSSAVSTIAVSPQDDNYRIFGRTDGSVFFTTTGANPMTALAGFPVAGKYVARAKFDPSNKNTAYIALGGYFGGTSPAQSHVWKITNLDTTPVVTAINSGLPDVPVNTFAVDPVEGRNLFAGTDIGVYGSSDGGANWMPYGTGLPVVAIFGMDIQPTSRTLRIGTHGRGAWKTVLPPLPDLTITKTHSGSFTQGSTGNTYTVTVTNSGGGEKIVGETVTVTDAPPVGLTVTAMSGSGWNCAMLPVCTRTDALAGNASYPALIVTVSVADNATSPQVNGVAVSSTQTEGDTGNNSATDSTVIVQPDLTITKTHSGNFTQGSTGNNYTVTVTNPGAGDKLAGQAVSVTDSPPSGLSVTAMSGAGWTCTTLPTCTRSDVLAASASYPALTVTVSVTGNATTPQVNSIAVTTAQNESNGANNTATDSTVIVQPDLTITKTHSGSFAQGSAGNNYTVTVTNPGAGDKLAGQAVSVTDSPPSGLSVTAMSGSGWTCTTLPTCTRSDVLTAGNSYPALTVTVSVAGNATTPRVNSIGVTTAQNESNGANNTATDSTVILMPDLTIAKAHVGSSFAQSQSGAQYTLTVTNGGTGSTMGTITVTDTLPAGLTFVSGSGTGWSCGAVGQVVTCTDAATPIAAGGTSTITLNVNVAPNAVANLQNAATVACDCTESNTGNNTSNTDAVTVTVTLIPVTGALSLGSGTINCSGPVVYGAVSSCIVVPATGTKIESISGCGGTPGSTSPYLTAPITAACTVTVVVASIPVPSVQGIALAVLAALLLAVAGWFGIRRRS